MEVRKITKNQKVGKKKQIHPTSPTKISKKDDVTFSQLKNYSPEKNDNGVSHSFILTYFIKNKYIFIDNAEKFYTRSNNTRSIA